MKIAHSVKITVFVKEGEDESGIRKKLLELLPFDISSEKIELKRETARGFNEKLIIILGILLEKDRHIDSFLENLIKNLSSETKELILKQAESRMDNSCNFFLRFDKEKLLKENELYLTDAGSCFHIKINVAAYPNKKEVALEIIRKLFKL